MIRILCRLFLGCVLLVGLAVPATAQQQNTGVFSRLWIDQICTIDTGGGSPEGAKTGKVCDLYLQTDGTAGTVLWVKESGTATTTGWTAIGAGGGGSSAHNLLSATHSDTIVNAALRGAVLVGQTATPRWARLTPTVTGSVLQFNGTDTVFGTDGSALTALNATNLASGTVPTARLGSGTASSSTVLTGDSAWTGLSDLVFTDPAALQQAATKNYVDQAIAAIGGSSGASQSSFLVSGGAVVWESNYQFRVSAASYYIGGTLYASAEQTVTLSAAHATLDRIDAIVVDDSGVVSAVAGTAAAQPSEPTIDGDQLRLSIVFVEAASTEPAGATSTLVYAENAGGPTEWNWTTSGSGISVSSTTNPRTGTVTIEGTNMANGAYAQGQIASGTLDPSTVDQLVLYIRSKATWNSRRVLRVQLQTSGVLVGAAVTITTGAFGFDSAVTGSYQQVAIPVLQFAVPTGQTINQIRIVDSGGAIGFYLDDISFLAGGTTGDSGEDGITQEQADARYAPLAPEFLVATAHATLPNERVLTAGTGITLTPGAGILTVASSVSGGAPTTATYITQTADAGLSAEQALSSLSTGPVKVTTGTGVLSSGAIDLATSEVTGNLPRTKLASCGETNGGSVSGATTIDFSSEDCFQWYGTLTGNITLTLSNPVASGRYLFIFTQDGTGSRTVTWPASVKWAGGTVPTLTTTAGATDICTLAYTAAMGGAYVAACNLNNQ